MRRKRRRSASKSMPSSPPRPMQLQHRCPPTRLSLRPTHRRSASTPTPRRRTSVTRGSSAVLACLLFAVPAHAQSPQAAAVVQFDKGRAALKANKFEEACKAFGESQKLDPANGTLFNLAECSEHIGKLATAWLAYREL